MSCNIKTSIKRKKNGKVKITKTMKKPKSCCKCGFFYTSSYRCHNESGYEAECELGFFNGSDMRDLSCKDTFGQCEL